MIMIELWCGLQFAYVMLMSFFLLQHGEPEVNIGKIKQQLIDEKAEVYRQMATGARKQGNFYVADLYLKLNLKTKTNKKQFDFNFFHSLVKLYCLKARQSSGNDAADKFLKALKFIISKKVC